MIRTLCLIMTVSVTALSLPTACVQEVPPPPPAPVVRGTIETRAETSATEPAASGAAVSLTAEVDAAPGTAFSWVQLQGPGVKIDNPNSAAASFAAPSFETQETLRFRVSTTNAAGDVGRADVTVIVQADPNFGFDTGGGNGGGNGGAGVTRPVARAGIDQLVEVATEVILDGSESTGRNLTFRWAQLSGPTVTLATPTAAMTTFDAPATFETGANVLVFELLVRDASGLSARDSITVRLRNRDGAGDAATRVRFDTTQGSFTLEMEDTRSPNTVANFLQYVDEDFYDNTILHRVVAGFVVQGGGYSAGLVAKTPRDPVQSESSNGLTNVRATVAMALQAGDPDSGTSQFFVSLVDNSFLDAQGFTVFARVVEGMDVIDRIAGLPTATRDGFENVPVTDIVVRDVVRIE